MLKPMRDGMAGVANIITYKQTQSNQACNFRFFDVVLASKESYFSELIYISIDLKGPSFPNSFTGYKVVRQFSQQMSDSCQDFPSYFASAETVRDFLFPAESIVRGKQLPADVSI